MRTGSLNKCLQRIRQRRCFGLLQERSIRVSWKAELRPGLAEIFQGQAFKPLLDACTALHAKVLRSRVFVALAHARRRR